MRTTITFDSDVSQRIQLLLRTKDKSLREIVNGLLREALAISRNPRKPNNLKLKTFSSKFATGVDIEKLNDLADTLEIEELQSKL